MVVGDISCFFRIFARFYFLVFGKYFILYFHAVYTVNFPVHTLRWALKSKSLPFPNCPKNIMPKQSKKVNHLAVVFTGRPREPDLQVTGGNLRGTTHPTETLNDPENHRITPVPKIA